MYQTTSDKRFLDRVNYIVDEKYLKLSRIFYHKEILEPLLRGEDILPGKHGNTQIPKLIGLARRYGESFEIRP
ncbi:unnamed protein product [marine sediment metagenome]|uniref:Non-reducing end beta-L-arabinofuranosidase-like GH127 catalytic domain-containing protein n=1 Tax=marine sediment metagenome TaxID=412755 RepID=X1S2A5_9ZZZZ